MRCSEPLWRFTYSRTRVALTFQVEVERHHRLGEAMRGDRCRADQVAHANAISAANVARDTHTAWQSLSSVLPLRLLREDRLLA